MFTSVAECLPEFSCRMKSLPIFGAWGFISPSSACASVCCRCVNRPVEEVAAAFRGTGSKSRASFTGMQLQRQQCHTFDHSWYYRQTDILCFVIDLWNWWRGWPHSHAIQWMLSSPCKVTKPLDHKGTLTTILSCLSVIMLMLRAQPLAEGLQTSSSW